MNWTSASDFFAMGGYALYVWGSFGMCFFAVALELLILRRHRRRTMRQLALRVAMDDAGDQAWPAPLPADPAQPSRETADASQA
ncbi:heme exporter protein CcmD [Laribacter hongkongensis]|uniref:heme exporter protein CcmD n=1 Tax=Laribacter hongkongensis TaxID=168471 RepID=UPI001EFDEFC4|nr:heme exporter protein CcmD [Laribacter hongkongensis]MCG9052198.1 heme exporter protein CcmD [Laribacter hongkongensis]MCG9080104.1 heme exporter protein CcmD [Laribacter hongkongensis]MCG9094075.1 heme exporter protein CcmD [Laribacter hongkongensis]